jgi:hypothetical protein
VAVHVDDGVAAGDVDGAVALGDVEDGEAVEGRGVLDVAGFGVEAGWKQASQSVGMSEQKGRGRTETYRRARGRSDGQTWSGRP